MLLVQMQVPGGYVDGCELVEIVDSFHMADKVADKFDVGDVDDVYDTAVDMVIQVVVGKADMGLDNMDMFVHFGQQTQGLDPMDCSCFRILQGCLF